MVNESEVECVVWCVTMSELSAIQESIEKLSERIEQLEVNRQSGHRSSDTCGSKEGVQSDGEPPFSSFLNLFIDRHLLTPQHFWMT